MKRIMTGFLFFTMSMIAIAPAQAQEISTTANLSDRHRDARLDNLESLVERRGPEHLYPTYELNDVFRDARRRNLDR
jgi:hypothetical protein